MEILNVLREMEQFGKEPLKGLKEELKVVRGALSPRLKKRRGGKGKHSEIWGKEITWKQYEKRAKVAGQAPAWWGTCYAHPRRARTAGPGPKKRCFGCGGLGHVEIAVP